MSPNDNNGISGPAPPKKSAVPAIVYHICRILLGVIFIVASFDKIQKPWMFGRAIDAYELLTGPLGYLVSPTVIILPLLEFVSGVLLVLNRLVRPSAILMLAMNVMFILIILSAIFRGLKVECGCGLDEGTIAKIAGTQADWSAVVRDLVFVAMNLVVLFAPQSHRK